MKLGTLFSLVVVTATLAACGGGGGGGDAPAATSPAGTTPAGSLPAVALAGEAYSFTSTTTPAVTFSPSAPGAATVTANEKFKITNGTGIVGNSSVSSVSGTCNLNITSISSAVYEVAFSAAPCVKKFSFTKGNSVAEITVTANAPSSTTPAVSYAGTYSCNIAGTDTGTLSFVMANATGSFSSCSGSTVAGGAFQCTGSVGSTGILSTAFSNTGGSANGQVTATGATANWTAGTNSGTISCTKA
jgi:hypothetical protein